MKLLTCSSRRPLGVSRWLFAGALVLGLTVTAAGCFVFHDDYPDNTCESSLDCFQAMGEVCDTVAKKCVLPLDAGTTPLLTSDTESVLPASEAAQPKQPGDDSQSVSKYEQRGGVDE